MLINLFIGFDASSLSAFWVRGLVWLPLLALSLAAGSAQAGVHTLNKLFVFGDSLSDAGNSKALSSGASGGTLILPPPSLGYVGGRYSNGEVAAEYLWQLFNPGDTSFRAFLAGGTNFAIGGATSGQENYLQAWPQTPAALKPTYADLGNAWQLDDTPNPAFPASMPKHRCFWFGIIPKIPSGIWPRGRALAALMAAHHQLD